MKIEKLSKFELERRSENGHNTTTTKRTAEPNAILIIFHFSVSLFYSLAQHRNIDEGEYREKMAELENKIKQEAEIREEALLKRISEKDKQITKMKWVS